MKKKSLLLFIVLGGMIILTKNLAFKADTNDILLNNIEALASDEGGTGDYYICHGSGNLTCPMTNKKVAVYIIPNNLLQDK